MSEKQMAVGELRKHLEKYPDDTRIFMEAGNTYNKGDTIWAQELLHTYECDDVLREKKGLMLVGSMR